MAYIFTNFNNLSTVGIQAFYGAGVNAIDNPIVDFTNCTSLTTLESNAFANSGISEVYLNNCTSIDKLTGNGLFANNNLLKKVDCTGCHINELGQSIFNQDPILETIIGWDDLKPFMTNIGASCFNNCGALDVNMEDFPELQNVDANAFTATNITSGIKNWPKIRTIGNSAFNKANKLAYVDLSNSELMSIGTRAFAGTSGAVSSSLDYINLSNCSNLTTIGTSSTQYTSIKYINLDNCTSLTSATGAFLDSSKVIEYITMRNCTSFTGAGGVNMFYGNAITNTTCKYCDMTGCTALTIIPQNFLNGHTQLQRGGWIDEIPEGENTFYAPVTKYPLLESIGSGSLRSSVLDKYIFDGILGTCPLNQSCISNIKKNAPVLISIKDCPNAEIFGSPDGSTQWAIVGGSAAQYILDLGVWPNCTKVQYATTGGAQLGSTPNTFDLDECFPNLTVIGDRAFSLWTTSSFKCLSGKITSIGNFAFAAEANNSVSKYITDIEITGAPVLTIGHCAFQCFAPIKTIKINGAATSLEIGDRCFGYTEATGSSAQHLNIYLPNIPTIGPWAHLPVIDASVIGECVMAGLTLAPTSVTFHFPASIETTMKDYARSLEDASVDGNIEYWMTSNGTMNTTTGGTSGDKTCSAICYYRDHNYFIESGQYGSASPERAAVKVGNQADYKYNIVFVFDL